MSYTWQPGQILTEYVLNWGSDDQDGPILTEYDRAPLMTWIGSHRADDWARQRAALGIDDDTLITLAYAEALIAWWADDIAKGRR